jgi:Ca-activated chloride channel homolog
MNETARFQTVDGEDMVLEGVKAQGRVVGRMLDMHLEQRFRNPSQENVEVVYTFPLPWKAVLLGLEVELNGKCLSGVVKARSDARAEYEEAVSEGNTGILLSVNANGTHTLELGNLLAGEVCVVRLHYVQVLQPEQGSLRLMLPTTLAPRYGDPLNQGKYEPHAVPVVDLNAEYPFELTLNIQGELTRARLASPSHPVSIRSLPMVGMREALQTEVRLAAAAWLDRDFVLVFDELAQDGLGLAAWDRLDAGLGVVMASFSPKLPTRQSLPVAMKVLVDCSGSMGGDSIQAARSALQGILTGLKPEDRFSLSRFGSEVDHRSKALWKCAPASMAAARRWVEKLEADLGGTEMERAIRSTLALPGGDRADILLITDGEIEDVDTVVEVARQSRHRFFVVGIGSSSAEGLLRQLAEQTGGSAEFVAPGEGVESAIWRLYRRMRSPVVTAARIEWPTGCTVHVASDVPKSVFEGDDLTVFARLKANQAEALCGAVRLVGQVDGVAGEVLLGELTPAFMANEDNTLARLAAHQRYWQLRRAGAEVPAVLKKQLPELAERYQLVTDDTSLVLVKARDASQQPTDMPVLRKVGSMLAAGWGGSGQVLYSRSSFAAASLTSPSAAPQVYNSVRRGTPMASARRRPAAPATRASRMLNSLAPGGRMGRVQDLKVFLDSLDASPTAPHEEAVWQKPPFRDEFWASPETDDLVTSKHLAGLTPVGLVESLRLNPRKLWPLGYWELDSIGVPERVIEWLELVVGAGMEQKAVVQAFLRIMSGYEFTFRQTVHVAMQKLQAAPGETTDPAAQQLQQRLREALDGMAATEWPACVLDYAETSTVS